MKFFTLVILPLDADISSEETFAAAIRAKMWPFRDRTSVGPEDDEAGDLESTRHLARWDSYSLYPWEELKHYGHAPQHAPGEDALLILTLGRNPAPGLHGLGKPAIVTPDSEWIDSPATRELDAEQWRAGAEAELARYAGHRAALLFCHG